METDAPITAKFRSTIRCGIVGYATTAGGQVAHTLSPSSASCPKFFIILKTLYKFQFIICVGHKIVKSVVDATMDPLEFLLMSPFLQNDGYSCSIIFLLFTMIIVSEVIQKTIYHERW
jgi:di/tricarboxylate transporter